MGGKWAMSHLQCQREALSRIKTEQPFPLDDSNATCHFLLTSWRSLALLQYDIEQHSTCTFFNSRLFWSALMMFVPCDSQWKFFILPSSTTSRNRSVHLHSSKGLFSAHVLLDSAWHSLELSWSMLFTLVGFAFRATSKHLFFTPFRLVLIVYSKASRH